VYDDSGLIVEILGNSKLENRFGEIEGEAESNATIFYDLPSNVIHISYKNKNLKGRESEDTDNLTGSFTCFLENGKIVKEADNDFSFDNLMYDEKGRAINLPSDYEESFILERDNNGFLKAFKDKMGFYSFIYCHDDVTDNSKRLVGFPTLLFYNKTPIMPIEIVCNLALQYQGFFGEPEPQLLKEINFSENGISYKSIYKFEYKIENKLVMSMTCNGEEIDDDGSFGESSICYKVLWESETGITHTNNSQYGKIQYYDLNGQNISSPQKGLYIVKMPNGDVKKTIRP